MQAFIQRHLTYANVMATMAVFIALGGVGYAAATIGTAQIKNSAVTESKIKAGAVTNSRLGPNAVSASKLAPNAVFGSKIAPNTVTTGDIADGQVIEGRGTMTMRTSVALGQGPVTLANFPGMGSLRLTCKFGGPRPDELPQPHRDDLGQLRRRERHVLGREQRHAPSARDRGQLPELRERAQRTRCP